MHDDRDRILTEIWERRKLAIDLRQKYELYFVSLIFTLAAASVQSATPGLPRWRMPIEVAGWVLLLAAGTVGLWRIGKLWVHQMAHAQIQARGDGGGWDEINELNRRIHRVGNYQNAAFLLGFIAIVISRATLLLGR
jgi:hypothetical protein